MDVRKVFRGISRKLLEDFKISEEIKHPGSKGTFRENALGDFLGRERLPLKYGVGSGEIVGLTNETSRQSDLIIFDRLNGVPLLFGEQVQVYPIDSVYGVVEVKSKLSKPKLLEALESIKSVKELSPGGTVVRSAGPFSHAIARPRPFGIVFAYALAGNSLQSLRENLAEWEKDNAPEFWPNYIVVLDEGVIYHANQELRPCLNNEVISLATAPMHIAYGKDSFLQFYSTLLDLCTSTDLAPPAISKYVDLPKKVGPFSVKHHDRMLSIVSVGQTPSVRRLNEAFIAKVVVWCKADGKHSFRAMLLKQLGQIPQGLSDERLDAEVYLYDPENLPGMHQVENPIIRTETGVSASQKMQMPSSYIEVDGEVYYYPQCYVSKDDIEDVPGALASDL